MATMGCKQFLGQLDAWLEGHGNADAQAHLRDCANCRDVAEDLGSIATAARAMATDEPEPPARVWTSLRAQLEREGLIRDMPARRTENVECGLARVVRGAAAPGAGWGVLGRTGCCRHSGERTDLKASERLPLDSRHAKLHELSWRAT